MSGWAERAVAAAERRAAVGQALADAEPTPEEAAGHFDGQAPRLDRVFRSVLVIEHEAAQQPAVERVDGMMSWISQSAWSDTQKDSLTSAWESIKAAVPVDVAVPAFAAWLHETRQLARVGKGGRA